MITKKVCAQKKTVLSQRVSAIESAISSLIASGETNITNETVYKKLCASPRQAMNNNIDREITKCIHLSFKK